jgi:DNA polymerase III epsilon subunit-like protein
MKNIKLKSRSKNDWSQESINRLKELYQNHSCQEISLLLNDEFGLEKTPNAIKKAFYRYSDSIVTEKKKPKVLLLDIETAPIIAHVWGLWDNNVGLNQVVKDWSILSWSAKWLHSDEILYEDNRKNKDVHNDKTLLKNIWKLMNEADIVIGHNSIAFDTKRLNARIIYNGFQPPSSFRQIDTKRIAKKHFGFTSNKLEYLADFLGAKYKKLKHKKYPGHELWMECLKGNQEAWNEMERYNKNDVLTLESVYYKLIPWDNSIDFNVYHDDTDNSCSSCGGTRFKKAGYHYSNTGKFQRYRCIDCGHESRDSKNLLSLEKRKSLRKKTAR